MCVYVCVCVYASACVCVCMYVYAGTLVHVCVCVCVCVCVYTCVAEEGRMGEADREREKKLGPRLEVWVETCINARFSSILCLSVGHVGSHSISNTKTPLTHLRLLNLILTLTDPPVGFTIEPHSCYSTSWIDLTEPPVFMLLSLILLIMYKFFFFLPLSV